MGSGIPVVILGLKSVDVVRTKIVIAAAGVDVGDGTEIVFILKFI